MPGFDIVLNAASIPDQFTVTDNSTGTTLLAPTLLGGTNYAGVSPNNGQKLTLTNVGAGDIHVMVQSNRVNACTNCTPIAGNTYYDVTYEKYKGFRIKVPLPVIK